MVLFRDGVFSCVITLLVRTDLAKIGLWRVHMREKFSLVGVDGNAFNMTRAGIPRALARGRNASSQIISQKTLDFP